MTMTVKTAILRIEDVISLARSLTRDLQMQSDLSLRPVLRALDDVEDALGHAVDPDLALPPRCLKCEAAALRGSNLCAVHWAEIRDQPLETSGNIFRACDAKVRTP